MHNAFFDRVSADHGAVIRLYVIHSKALLAR
jgi:hypothetical protein